MEIGQIIPFRVCLFSHYSLPCVCHCLTKEVGREMAVKPLPQGGFHIWRPRNFLIFFYPPLSLSQISWFCPFRLLFGDPLPHPLVTYINRLILFLLSAFLWPPVTVTNQLILFLSSAFWGPPPSTHFGRHIWKPPNGLSGVQIVESWQNAARNASSAHGSRKAVGSTLKVSFCGRLAKENVKWTMSHISDQGVAWKVGSGDWLSRLKSDNSIYKLPTWVKWSRDLSRADP